MYVSVIVPISRPEGVDLVCEQLQKLSPNYTYELIVAIDNKRISAFNTEVKLRKCGVKFRNIEVFNTGRPAPSQTSIPRRRDRIVKTMKEIQQRIGGSDFVFGFEDDTILPDMSEQLMSRGNVIDELIDTYQAAGGKVGFVQGLQKGRWGVPYLGAWRVDDIEHPTRYSTISRTWLREGFRDTEIDAGGFYCFLTPTALFKEVEHKWEEPVGPDVNYGLWLRRQGYRCLAVGSIACGHVQGDKILWPHNFHTVNLFILNGEWVSNFKVS